MVDLRRSTWIWQSALPMLAALSLGACTVDLGVGSKRFACDPTKAVSEDCLPGYTCELTPRNTGICWPEGEARDCSVLRCVGDTSGPPDTATDAVADACGPSGSCDDAESCPPGQAPCVTGSCIDTATSVEHCGACGVACSPGSLCVNGSCRCGDGPACTSPNICCAGACLPSDAAECDCGGAGPCRGAELCCDDVCLAVTTSSEHCGACGVACPSGASCAAGTCSCLGATCPASAPNATAVLCGGAGCSVTCDAATSFGDCDGNVLNGCETDLSADAAHCGVCGAACGATGAGCVGGSCDPIVQVVAGRNFACARHASGHVACWGADTMAGKLGNGEPIVDQSRPVGVALAGAVALDNATFVDAHDQHACAVDADGGLLCWGEGFDTTSSFPHATTFAGFPPASEPAAVADRVALGRDFGCVLAGDQKVFCFGEASVGQLGNGGFTPSLEAVPAAGLTNVRQLAVGNDHGCAVKDDDTLWCWGGNAVGQLGLGDLNPRPSPQLVLSGVALVALGAEHTCAALTSGELHCWGSNKDYRLGLDDTSTCAGGCGSYHTPQHIATLACTPTALALGPSHSCATCDAAGSTELYCWGDNTAGEARANGSTGDDQKIPFLVAATSDVVGVALGNFFTCTARADGGVVCWGAGESGQLGAGGNASVPQPVHVAGLP